MGDVSEKLWKCLTGIKGPGGFCSGGPFPGLHPGLVVNNLGMVGLPLSNDKAKELSSVCSSAPFGRGEETVYDKSVRNTWQLDPSQFKIANPEWHETVVEFANSKIKTELGVPVIATVVVKLYKLLLYEEGGFFTPHRDTEKEDGMFATLVILLPSTYTGGELVVKHKDSERIFDYAKDNGFGNYYTVLYADCLHEVKPVSSGNRLALIYNLLFTVYDSVAIPPPAPSFAVDEMATIQVMEKIFTDWTALLEQDADVHDKIAIVLEHKYTKAGLHWQQLKSKDYNVARIVKEVASKTDIVCHLAMLEFCKTSYYHMGEKCDGDTDKAYSISDFVNAHGKNISCFGDLSIDPDDILPKNVFKGKPPDKDNVTEATGNEGATREQWYHRSVIVLWPSEYSRRSISHEEISDAVAHCADFMSLLDDNSSDNQQKELIQNVKKILSRIEKAKDKENNLRNNECMEFLRVVKFTKSKALFSRYVKIVAMNCMDCMDPEAFIQLARCCDQFGLDVIMPCFLELTNTEEHIMKVLLVLKEMCIGTIDTTNFPKELVILFATKLLENLSKLEDDKQDAPYFVCNDKYKLHSNAKSNATAMFCIYTALGNEDWLQQAIDCIVRTPVRHPVETVAEAIVNWHKWLKDKMNQTPETVATFQFAQNKQLQLTEECIKRLKLVKQPVKPAKKTYQYIRVQSIYEKSVKAITALSNLLPADHELNCQPADEAQSSQPKKKTKKR